MNNDLISREALKKAIKTECNPYGKPTIDFESGKKVLELIDNAPTVDFMISPDYVTELQNHNKELFKQLEEAERPQGEWIVQRLQNGFEDVYCPFCKARPTRSEYGYYLKDKFCHECGADMRKGGRE